MKRKGFLLALLTLVILFGAFTPVHVMATDVNGDIMVVLDGEELTFDIPPQLIDGRALVPMRRIFEALGADVVWIRETLTITARRDDTIVIMQIDNVVISVDGTDITLDVPPQLGLNRTLVPIRAVAESLDAGILWDEATRTIIITSDGQAPEIPPSIIQAS